MYSMQEAACLMVQLIMQEASTNPHHHIHKLHHRHRQGDIHNKMKHKMSITMEEKTAQDISNAVSTGKFRSKSHIIEYAVKKLLEEKDG